MTTKSLSEAATVAAKISAPVIPAKPKAKAGAARRAAEAMRLKGGRYAEAGPPIDASLGRLLQMLTYKRPAGSATEEAFIAEFIAPLDPWADTFGNHWIQVGDTPNILWSCHTDTVHHEPGRQKTFTVGPMAWVDGESCLGADDTAGVWLCLEMIRAGVPGLYGFHREEEVGGGGSMYVASKNPGLLEGIAFAIALDRKGYDSVITHQGARCCSDDFAESLADILGGRFAPDDTGLFTDTANYTDIVGECTNLSVGYFSQHGPGEHLDLGFVAELRDKLCAADFSSLVAKREPGEFDPDESWAGSWGRGSAYGGSYSGYSGGGWVQRMETLYDIVSQRPVAVSNWLKSMDVTAADLARELGIDLADER